MRRDSFAETTASHLNALRRKLMIEQVAYDIYARLNELTCGKIFNTKN